jgi:hypothetical protein
LNNNRMTATARIMSVMSAGMLTTMILDHRTTATILQAARFSRVHFNLGAN